MRYHAANRFQTRLAASVDESQIYFDVESASGCPEVPFKLTVGTEIVDVIGVAGNTFTVQRGAEGTTPQGHPEGAFVQNRWTAGTYEDLWDGVDDLRDNVDDLRDNVEAHLAESAIHKTSDVIRTETKTKLKVEVVSSSGSETPDAGRIIFDTSQGKFFGGNGSGWV